LIDVKVYWRKDAILFSLFAAEKCNNFTRPFDKEIIMKIARLTILLIFATLSASVYAAKPIKPVNPFLCTPITSLPTTISTPGVYCLTGSLTSAQTTGNAITISANDVTLDLSGWTVDGQAAGTGTTANGIYSTAANVTIRNGTVRGFFDGVRLDLGSNGATVRAITTDLNTRLGIYVAGHSSLIQGNQVLNTGGSTTAVHVNVDGINSAGEGTLVDNNLVSGLTATGGGSETGIALTTPQSTARGNVVNDTARPTGGGVSVGILAGGAASAVVNNIVPNFTYGVDYAGTGVYSRNTVVNCTNSYTGSGTAGSGND